MAKLTLKFEEKVLREFALGSAPVGIGRLPDNVVVIDNPAVSGHHARVTAEGDQFFIEDLGSTNGTFVNQVRLTARQTLKAGDVVQIGKHKLAFDPVATVEAAAPAAPAAAVVPDIGGTFILDTKQQKEMMAKIKAEAEAKKAAAGAAAGGGAAATPAPAKPAAAAAPAAGAPVAAAAAPAAVPTDGGKKVAILTVISGSTDKPEYELDAATVMIGKAATAHVKLKGWFKPNLAAAINHKGEHYQVTLLEGKGTLNKQPISGRQDLKPGDLLEISGVTLVFKFKE